MFEFDGIPLKPCLLQPYVHVAGPRRLAQQIPLPRQPLRPEQQRAPPGIIIIIITIIAIIKIKIIIIIIIITINILIEILRNN